MRNVFARIFRPLSAIVLGVLAAYLTVLLIARVFK